VELVDACDIYVRGGQRAVTFCAGAEYLRH